MFGKAAQLGVMGFIAIIVVAAVAGIAVYSVVYGVETDSTKQAVTALTMGVGAIIASASRFFGGPTDTSGTKPQ